MISHDAGLSHKLLRLANSAHVAPRNRVRSIRHALSLLGGRTVRRWTMLLMLAGRHGQPHELLVTALVRARLCEKLAAAAPRPRTTAASPSACSRSPTRCCTRRCRSCSTACRSTTG